MTAHRTARLAVAVTTVMLLGSACSSTETTNTAAAASTQATSSITPTTMPAQTSPSRSVQPERSAPSVPTEVDPALAGVDRGSIEAVATTVVTEFSTADTTIDTGPNDAAARTISLLTADYAAAIVNTPPLRSPGAQWNDWTAQGVRLSATVEALPDDRPADTATTATRIYLVTQTPTTSSGQVLDPVVTVAYVGLQRTDTGWSVGQVEQR